MAVEVPEIAVLCGGQSSEREVSLRSGRNFFEALGGSYQTRLIELEENCIPDDLDPATTVVFPAMHGEFGEDGELQLLLERADFAYAGSGAAVSALCMSKVDTKLRVAAVDVRAPPEMAFASTAKPSPKDVVAALGKSVVLKPTDKGSSVGLYYAEGEDEITVILEKVEEGNWMFERRITGRELSVGLLHGRGLGVVEICPQGGVYDYYHKYTPGASVYHAPANLPKAIEQHARRTAEIVFAACGCRDFARADFMLDDSGTLYFLEVNTIPGLTKTSLLPMSAACQGYDFPTLARKMVAPAVARFQDAFYR